MFETLGNIPLKYTGKVQPARGEKDEYGPLYPYQPTGTLVEAVNLAIYLKRPLLIKGEPGCGKTRLARAVAYELKLPYEPWHVKSTSRARDGLYTYDSIGRLRDAQLAGSNQIEAGELAQIVARVGNPASYIKWGPLGRAFRNDQRTVVLIDEIDKADIDFPNDLLLELDERRSKVEETELPIQAKEGLEPIIFITSNDERYLPDAFLRRCLFYYIKFPDEKDLIKIVKLHFHDAPEDLVNKAVVRFQELRNSMGSEAGKRVSTSELLDWFDVLSKYPHDKDIRDVEGKLPISILFKNWDNLDRYLRLINPKGSS